MDSHHSHEHGSGHHHSHEHGSGHHHSHEHGSGHHHSHEHGSEHHHSHEHRSERRHSHKHRSGESRSTWNIFRRKDKKKESYYDPSIYDGDKLSIKQKMKRLLDLRVLSLIAILIVLCLSFTRMVLMREYTDLSNPWVRYFLCRQVFYSVSWIFIFIFFLFYFTKKDGGLTTYINTSYISRVSRICTVLSAIRFFIVVSYCYIYREIYPLFSFFNITEWIAWLILTYFFFRYSVETSHKKVIK